MKQDLLTNVEATKENAQKIVAQLVVENANMQRRIHNLLKENAEWKLENDRLNNIIDELEKDMKETIEILKSSECDLVHIDYVVDTFNIYCMRLKELKEGK